MNLIIAGGRDIEVYWSEIGDLVRLNSLAPTRTVCGCALGVDTAGLRWARLRGIPVEFFPAWPKHLEFANHERIKDEVIHPLPPTQGRSAGAIRNSYMADFGDALLLIWDGKSPGSTNMFGQMQRRNKPVFQKIVA